MALDLSSTPKPPPAKRATRKATGAAEQEARQAATKAAAREQNLNDLFGIVAAACMMSGQLADAATLHKHGENVAREAAPLGDRYESFGNFLDWLGNIGPFAGLAMAALPMAMQIAVNHQMLPVTAVAQFGVEDPEVLRTKLTTDILNQQAAALQEQLQQQQEAAEAQARAHAALAALQNPPASPVGTPPEGPPANHRKQPEPERV